MKDDRYINKLNVSRIGHGVRSIEDQDVIDLIIERNIHLEICPTCNIVCDVYDVYESHPVNLLKRIGVNIGINTDTRTVANITLCEEYLKINRYFDWQYIPNRFRVAARRQVNESPGT